MTIEVRASLAVTLRRYARLCSTCTDRQTQAAYSNRRDHSKKIRMASA
jgi:hypothetical protein